MTGRILVSTPDLRPSLTSVLKGLEAIGLLGRVVTTCSINPAHIDWLLRSPFLSQHLGAALNRRQTPPYLVGKVDNIWTREIARSLTSHLASATVTHRVWEWAEKSFDRKVG